MYWKVDTTFSIETKEYEEYFVFEKRGYIVKKNIRKIRKNLIYQKLILITTLRMIYRLTDFRYFVCDSNYKQMSFFHI